MNQHAEGDYRLRLYVAGRTGKSLTTLDNLQRACEGHLAGHYEIEVVDLLQSPKSAVTDQIVATPTLLRRQPAPPRRIIGTLSDTKRLLFGLDIGSYAPH